MKNPPFFFLLLLLPFFLSAPLFIPFASAFSVHVSRSAIPLGEAVDFWFNSTNNSINNSINSIIRYRIELNGALVKPAMTTNSHAKREFMPKSTGKYTIIAQRAGKNSKANFTVLDNANIPSFTNVPYVNVPAANQGVYKSSSLTARDLAMEILLALSVFICCGVLWKNI